LLILRSLSGAVGVALREKVAGIARHSIESFVNDESCFRVRQSPLNSSGLLARAPSAGGKHGRLVDYSHGMVAFRSGRAQWLLHVALGVSGLGLDCYMLLIPEFTRRFSPLINSHGLRVFVFF
jgi:hypothetical protein